MLSLSLSSLQATGQSSLHFNLFFSKALKYQMFIKKTSTWKFHSREILAAWEECLPWTKHERSEVCCRSEHCVPTSPPWVHAVIHISGVSVRVLLDKTGFWISDFSKVHGPSSADRHCWIFWTDRGRETACLWLTVGTEHQHRFHGVLLFLGFRDLA